MSKINVEENKQYKSGLHPYYWAIIKSYASACQWAIAKHRIPFEEFFLNASHTDVFKNYSDRHDVYVQGSSCIASIIEEEISANGVTLSKSDKNDDILTYYDGEAAYWLGYVLMYWILLMPEDLSIIQKIDYSMAYYQYDSLHTQSLKYTIDYKDEANGICR